MNLSNEIRKHFYPQFKKMGFSKYGFLWRCDIEDNWITAVEVKSEKSYKNENEAILEFDIGFFSFELDDMMGGSREVGYRRDQLPAGIITCHFETSLFQLNETADWNKSAHHFQFFQDDGTLDAQFKSMSDKFEHVMPIARQRYATFEALIDCKKNQIGTTVQSKQKGLVAAAAAIKLGRFKEAEKFLEESIRPGSIEFDKRIGKRLFQLMS